MAGTSPAMTTTVLGMSTSATAVRFDESVA